MTYFSALSCIRGFVTVGSCGEVRVCEQCNESQISFRGSSRAGEFNGETPKYQSFEQETRMQKLFVIVSSRPFTYFPILMV